jgi:transcription-repair coupling factor (superfamily II helicase)
MTADAVKRLEAITLSQDLGAGFVLATHDLEIRGAGELLGEEQSGQIQSVGFSLYMELLEQTVEALQSGKTPDLAAPFKHGTEINLRLPAIIPEDYLPDVHTRLILYKRIANAKTKSALSDIQSEIIDRFGILPEQVKLLIKQTRLKLRAEKAGIAKIDAGDIKGKITFAKETSVDPFVIVQLVQKNAPRFGLNSGNELSFQLKTSKPNDKLQEINDILSLLGIDDK